MTFKNAKKQTIITATIGTEVAQKAVAAYITDILKHPAKDVKTNAGANKPGVYRGKPSFY